MIREKQPDPEGDLATSTLAEIYAQQGLYQRALAIYQRLALRSPRDEGIAERISDLTRRIDRSLSGEPAENAMLAADAGPPEVLPGPAPMAEIPTPVEEPDRDDEFQAWLERR